MKRSKGEKADQYVEPSFSTSSSSSSAPLRVKSAASSQQARQFLQQHQTNNSALSGGFSTFGSGAFSSFDNNYPNTTLTGSLDETKTNLIKEKKVNEEENKSSNKLVRTLPSNSSSSLSPSLSPSTSSSPFSYSYASIPIAETNAPPLDTELSLCLKNLTKKDSITKVKSFDKLLPLLHSSSSNNLISFLSHWIPLHIRLSFDNDRRIRENLYCVLSILIPAVRKSLAIYLKSLFPYWYMHMHDINKEVIRSSTSAFNSAFPSQSKQSDLLKYVKKDYFGYLAVLFKTQPSTLSDMTVTSVRESEERYERTITSAQLSLSTYITHTHEISTAETELINQAINFTTSKIPTLRRSSYILLNTILTESSYVPSNPSILVLIWSIWSEKERICHSSMWNLLLNTSKLELIWPSLDLEWKKNKKENIWSGFYKHVESAAYGSTNLLYSNLLPFVSQLPSSAFTSTDISLEGYFTSLLSSLQKSRSILDTNNDIRSFFNCYLDICLWIIITYKTSDTKVSSLILYNQYFSMLENLLMCEEDQFPSKTLGKQLSIIEKHIVSAPSSPSSSLTLDSFFEQISELSTNCINRQLELEKSNIGLTTNSNHKIIFSRLVELFGAMQEERIKYWNKQVFSTSETPLKDIQNVGKSKSRGQEDEKSDSNPSSSSIPYLSSSDPLLAISSSIFHSLISNFITTFSSNTLALVVEITKTFPLIFLLSANSSTNSTQLASTTCNSQSLINFLQSTLLPIYRLLSSSEIGSDRNEYERICDLFISLIDQCATLCGWKEEKEGSESLLEGMIKQLHISSDLSVAAPDAPGLSLSYHLVLFASLLRLFVQLPYFKQTGRLDDLILTHAETLLTISDQGIFSKYQEVFSLILNSSIVTEETKTAIFSSFIDAISSYLSCHSLISLTPLSSLTFYTTTSGSSLSVLPTLLNLVSPLLNRSHAQKDLWCSYFFLQFVEDRNISSAAAKAWNNLSGEVKDRSIDSLISIGEVFRSSLFSLPLSQLSDSKFIVSFGDHVASLLSSLTSDRQYQSVLNSILPNHTEIIKLINRDTLTDTEHLRVIRDCIGEIIQNTSSMIVLGGKLPFDKENISGNIRSELICDLIALEMQLDWHSTHSAHIDSNSQTSFLQTIISAINNCEWNENQMNDVLVTSIKRSKKEGKVYAEALAWLLKRISTLSTLPLVSSLPSICTQHVILPLAGIADLSSKVELTSYSFNSMSNQLNPAMLDTFLSFLTVNNSIDSKLIDLIFIVVVSDIESRLRGRVQNDSSSFSTLLRMLGGMLQYYSYSYSLQKLSLTNLDRIFRLLPSLPSPSANLRLEFYSARSSLVLSLISLYEKNAYPLSYLQPHFNLLTTWYTQEVASCNNETPPQIRSFSYLSVTSQYFLLLLPILCSSPSVSSSSTLSSSVLSATQLTYSFLLSPILPLISVTRYEKTLSTFSKIVNIYLGYCNIRDKVTILDDFLSFVNSPTTTNFAYPSPYSLTEKIPTLFSLLSHPFPLLALGVSSIISTGLSLHVSAVDLVEADVDTNITVVKQKLEEDSEEVIESDGKKRKKRLIKERQERRERVNSVLPSVMQHICESHLSFNPSHLLSLPFTPEPFLIMRAYMLTYHILLDLLSVSTSAGTHSYLLSYVKSIEMGNLWNECITHISIAATSSQINSYVEYIRAKTMESSNSKSDEKIYISIAPTLEMILPSIPIEDSAFPVVDNGEESSNEPIYYPSLSSYLYIRSLHLLPGLCRSWYNNSERILANRIQRLTATHFSPLLTLLTLSSVQTIPTIENLQVRVDSIASVITASFSQGEGVTITLLLTLPLFYPLQLPSIEFNDSMRSESLHNRWKLLLVQHLTNEGVSSAVKAWAESVQRMFAGVEECPSKSIQRDYEDNRTRYLLPSVSQTFLIFFLFWAVCCI